MLLNVMYITNNPAVAITAEKNGVNRIMVDLETLGKEERQKNMNTVKSHHTVEDVSAISRELTEAELLVRVNPWNCDSAEEIEAVISAGADRIMLPMWKTLSEVDSFLKKVNGRVGTTLLLETKEAVEIVDEVLKNPLLDEIHIGLNDLHLSYGLAFMFELLTNGVVEALCQKFKAKGIQYGFGGIARIGEGTLPAERIVMEHYRLGSTRAILSRSFCNAEEVKDIATIETIFAENMVRLRQYEKTLADKTFEEYKMNRQAVYRCVEQIVEKIKEKGYAMTTAEMKQLAEQVGDAFYLLKSKQFAENFIELKSEFTKIYPHFNIAYSYKTNYTPKLCRIVNELGGLAEVVSDMEMEIALRVGVEPKNIVWNGPFKNGEKVEQLLVMGGTVNLDSAYEIELISRIAEQHPNCTLNVGIRCNFDVNDGVISRFGFDVDSEDFQRALRLINKYENLHLIGLQCHFATRRLDTWKARVKGMLALVDKLGFVPEHIDLGGGLFGKMADSLKAQFDTEIPTYRQYAEAVAPVFAEHFKRHEQKPMLLIEPGSALVGDCMCFASKVVNIKEVRGKAIATLLGSVYNINPTLNKKNPPIEVYAMGAEQKAYDDLDFGGFTCIESDYLYCHFNGKLAKGDMVVFGNVGSYSVVLKPPFILPNFPIIDISEGHVESIKRGETFDDLFHTFVF